MLALTSSPPAIAAPGCDVCDLYAFPSPDGSGKLVLVMTMVRRAVPTMFFSDSTLCRFRLRPVAIAGVGAHARFRPGSDESELVIDCSFSSPSPRVGAQRRAAETVPERVQQGRCATRAGVAVSVGVHDRRGGAGHGLRMFAGLVSDPFICQFESLSKTIAIGRMAFQKEAKNSLEGANVLGLVIEIARDPWLAGGPLYAVVGETLTRATPPARVERVGRPEVKNISLRGSRYEAIGRSADVCTLYNQEDAFHVAGAHVDCYRTRLNANLKFFDGLDGKIDWPANQEGDHPLVDLVLDDYLVVDVSRPYSEVSYFEIEQAMLDARAHQTCGGRALNDDFLDTTYTLLINAGRGPRISDGVDQATVPASDVFPYLAPPNLVRAHGRPGRGSRATAWSGAMGWE